ncbi:alpha-L-fucosidase [Flexivirga meconopsidis]|uniref:alpha-L-fucosidase n=1 Tax=Flexivirga meconopsidis TaxID=2977121 RepID=UPI00223F6605|nr:alpha-L-fucosidase [Flexivirga meconopsidis]
MSDSSLDSAAPLRPSLGAGVVSYEADPGYVWPADEAVRQRLSRWQGLKFGIIVHWGLYAALGEDGSWTLCRSRDEGCMQIPAEFDGDDDAWQEHYVSSRKSFTGSAFDASEWMDAIDGAGARYVVLTTKHHDGFSMFDTALSDYKSTAADVPFGRDFVAELTSQAAARGLRTGLYFSKADWHHPGYWAPDRAPVDRFHNHDDPRLWSQFVDFTHGQLRELLTGYGEVDVLWLDAGWVKAPREDVKINELATLARQLRPGILVVDREVHTSVEDYRTPEQRIPDGRLDHPWESCITLTDHWCTVPDPGPRKSVREVAQLLVTIVARGGNLLLGVGPDGEGRMPDDIAESLRAIGEFVTSIGPAIFDTRPVTEGVVSGIGGSEQLVDDQGRTWWLTQAGDRINLIHLHEPGSVNDGLLRIPLAAEPRDVQVSGSQRSTGWRWIDGAAVVGLAGDDAGSEVPTTVVSIELVATGPEH